MPVQGFGAVRWEMVEGHEEQAQRNHYQTLSRLAERGGLDSMELVAVLEDRDYRKRWPEMILDATTRDRLVGEAKRRLTELCLKWRMDP